MKYSLRSLMIVVTLVCVVLGSVAGRIGYLSSKADFHELQYAKSLGHLTVLTNHKEDEIQALLKAFSEIDQDDRVEGAEHFFFDYADKKTAKNRDKFASEWKAAYTHRRLAEVYRHAVGHPFWLVDESPPPPLMGIP